MQTATPPSSYNPSSLHEQWPKDCEDVKKSINTDAIKNNSVLENLNAFTYQIIETSVGPRDTSQELQFAWQTANPIKIVLFTYRVSQKSIQLSVFQQIFQQRLQQTL